MQRRPGSPHSKKLALRQPEHQCDSTLGSFRKYRAAPFWEDHCLNSAEREMNRFNQHEKGVRQHEPNPACQHDRTQYRTLLLVEARWRSPRRQLRRHRRRRQEATAPLAQRPGSPQRTSLRKKNTKRAPQKMRLPPKKNTPNKWRRPGSPHSKQKTPRPSDSQYKSHLHRTEVTPSRQSKNHFEKVLFRSNLSSRQQQYRYAVQPRVQRHRHQASHGSHPPATDAALLASALLSRRVDCAPQVP